MTTAIELEHVSKRFRIPHVGHGTLRGRVLHPFTRTTYEEFTALDDVCLEIHEGEFFGIVGRNGSGKSTLLKLIAGIYRPDGGVVHVRGSVAPFIELGVGFNPELSGRDNVFINGALLGLSSKRLRERYQHIVDFAELDRFMDLKLRNFSSGMQVRLAFSIALEAGAEILLTDEVLAVGDDRFQRKCFDVFRERKAAGNTVIFVSHDMSAMIDFCDRSMLLEDGHVELVADTRSVINRYRAGTVTSPGSAEGARSPVRIDGERDAWISDVQLLSEGHEDVDATVVEQGEQVTIRITASFNRDFVDPIVGVVIRDRIGKMVVVNNTSWLEAATGRCRMGETLQVDFTMPIPLAVGLYRISAGIVEAGPGPRLDLREDALEFHVEGPLETGGVVDPPVEVSISRDAAAAVVAAD